MQAFVPSPFSDAPLGAEDSGGRDQQRQKRQGKKQEADRKKKSGRKDGREAKSVDTTDLVPAIEPELEAEETGSQTSVYLVSGGLVALAGIAYYFLKIRK